MGGMDEFPEAVRSFRRRLLAFYDARARALPWRESTDPYAVWVSEIMAQQTRVETAAPYYRRWLERFPTVTALAEAPLDDVLKSWEGLGYYSRARNLHRAARVVAEELGGEVPGTVDGLRALPGIGDYTAGAIASIAFGRAAPAVDGNVRRVYARLHDEAEPASADVVRWAASMVDPDRPGDFNQALMELGATVCVPRGPACGACPVEADCRARAAGTVHDRPAPKKRSAVRREVRAVGVFVRRGEGGDRVLLRRRPDEGLLAGLWEFPSVPLGARAGARALAAAVGELARGLGLVAGDAPGGALEPVPHAFSHLHVTYRPWVVGVRAAKGGSLGQGRGDPAGSRWADPADPGELALPVAQQRIAEMVSGFSRRSRSDG